MEKTLYWSPVYSILFCLVLVWLSHMLLKRVVYPRGKKAAYAAAVIGTALAIYLLAAGWGENTLRANFYGIIAGLFAWMLLGEITEFLELGWDINARNFWFVPLLVFIHVFRVARGGAIDAAMFQCLNFWFATWLGHITLLGVYYSPVFGGETKFEGKAWRVWSPLRRRVSLAVAAAELVLGGVIIYLVWFSGAEFFATMPARVAAGYWLIVLFWSVFFELPMKWFKVTLT